MLQPDFFAHNFSVKSPQFELVNNRLNKTSNYKNAGAREGSRKKRLRYNLYRTYIGIDWVPLHYIKRTVTAYRKVSFSMFLNDVNQEIALDSIIQNTSAGCLSVWRVQACTVPGTWWGDWRPVGMSSRHSL
jgi:hypothetical protein